MWKGNYQKLKHEYPELQCLKFSFISCLEHELLPLIFQSNQSLLISGPAQIAKSSLFEVCLSKYISSQISQMRVIYLASTDQECEFKKIQIQQRLNCSEYQFKLTILNRYNEIDQKQIISANIIITTIERLQEFTYHACFEKINFVYINRIHSFLLTQSGQNNYQNRKRSNLFENILLKFSSKTRIVGLCLPVDNFASLASWLKIGQVKIINKSDKNYEMIKQTETKLQMKNNSYAANQNLQKLKSKEQFLNQEFIKFIKNSTKNIKNSSLIVIYCQSRKGAVETCSFLLSKIQDQHLTFSDSDLSSRVQCSILIEDQVLKKMMTLGICFYSSSMNTQDKQLILKEIKNKTMKIVCISMGDFIQGSSISGVLVILKGTSGWRGLKRGYGVYSEIDIKSLMGAVGVYGKSQSADFIQIVNEKGELKPFRHSIGKLVSQFQCFLKQNINALIYLRKAKTLNQVMKHVKSTFYHTNLKQAHKLDHFQIDKLILSQCQTTLQQLFDLKLILMKHDQEIILPQKLSQIFKAEQLSCQTLCFLLQKILSNSFLEKYLQSEQKLSLILSYLAKAPQFADFSIKSQLERKYLRNLNSSNKLKSKKINNHQDKVFILIQIYLNKVQVQQTNVKVELFQIVKIFKKIVNFICECFKISGKSSFNIKINFDILFCFYQLNTNLIKGTWEEKQSNMIKSIPVLKQHQKVLQKYSIDTIQKLKQYIKAKKLSSICHKFQNQIQLEVQNWINNYRMNLTAQKQNNYLRVSITLCSQFKENHRSSKNNKNLASEKFQVVAIQGGDQICVVNFSGVRAQNELFLTKFKQTDFPLRIGVIFFKALGFNQQFILERKDDKILDTGVKCYARDMYNSCNLNAHSEKGQCQIWKLNQQDQKTQEVFYCQNNKNKRISEQATQTINYNRISLNSRASYKSNNSKDNLKQSKKKQQFDEKYQRLIIDGEIKAKNVYSLNQQLIKFKKL